MKHEHTRYATRPVETEPRGMEFALFVVLYLGLCGGALVTLSLVDYAAAAIFRFFSGK